MRLNHRNRLAVISAATSGLVLFVLFAAIVFFSRRDVLNDRETELDAVMRSFTPPGDPAFDLDEFHAAHPELSASVFESGNPIGKVGNVPPPYLPGFHQLRGRLLLGKPFQGQQIAISANVREMERGLRYLTLALIVVWFPLTLLIGAIAWAAAQSVFRPLERLSAQALAMGGSNLSERLVTPDQAEFGAFAADLNAMLDRIEETVRRGERFSADAAHELRTPLAILRMRLETTLLQPRSQETYEATLRRSVEEIGRLTATTEALLHSARGHTVAAVALDLLPLVDEAVDRWGERFAERTVGLEFRAESAHAKILADEVRVVLDNLLDNALRYAPTGTTVVLLLAEDRDEVSLSVQDSGPGVPPELGERIFDRFVRGDDSRNRASGGAGIGLAVCRQIVTGRGGSMTLSALPTGGVEIGCRLPKAS